MKLHQPGRDYGISSFYDNTGMDSTYENKRKDQITIKDNKPKKN